MLFTAVMISVNPSAAAETSASSASTTLSPTTETATEGATVADYKKTFILTLKNGAGVVIEEPQMRMFWEYPMLPAGQTREGSITIRNDTGSILRLSLSGIVLPEDNKPAMDYLSDLKINVSDSGGKTLYHGSYSDISGGKGLDFSLISIEPGKAAEYRITMSCAFNYTGVPSADTAPVKWNIIAEEQLKPEEIRNNSADILGICLIILTLSCGALIVIQLIKIWKLRSGGKNR